MHVKYFFSPYKILTVPVQRAHSCHTSCTGNTRTHTHTHIHTRSFSTSNLVCLLVHSELLDVPVFFPQDGNLVPEQHRVQPHLGVHQRHETQPVTEVVHAGLSLGKMVGVSPLRCLGTLGLEGEIDVESSFFKMANESDNRSTFHARSYFYLERYDRNGKFS